MHAYEKEISNREMLAPACSYPYKVIPLSDQAKSAFALYNKHHGELEKRQVDLVKKYLNVNEFPFVGQMTFYYDDPRENEDMRKVMTKELAIKNMADRWVPGIIHPDIPKKTGFATLIENKDYKIEVGEKITHDIPKPVTFDAIKAL